MKKSGLLAVVIGLASIGWVLPAKAQQPCQAYTVDRPETPYGYEEINNCPLMSGTFANDTWQVEISGWEPAAYRYQGRNLRDGSSIQLIDFHITGTTERPQYRFHNGDTTYVVTFRYADPNTIRLEVFQSGRLLLNQLLYR